MSQGERPRIKFGKPLISDKARAAVADSLKNRQLTNGGVVRQFEEEFSQFIGGGDAIAVSSCTAALYLAMKALDIGPGDEVVVPAQTFVACAHAVEAVGARPVFVDVWPDSGVMDPALFEKAITPKTKAVMPVHYAGRPAYMGTILDIARRHNLRVIEDCATALGATHSGKHVGLLGDVGCFSFHPVKHITTAEGGMVVTTNAELGERIRRMREFGKKTNPYGYSWEMYDIVDWGFNFRMTEMQATLGINQLFHLPYRLKAREMNWRALTELLKGFTFLETRGAWYAFIVVLPDHLDQADIRQKLAAAHVETSVYYPGPLPLLTYYRKKYNHTDGQFPNAERIAKKSIAFSVGPHLGTDLIRDMAERFIAIAGEGQKQ